NPEPLDPDELRKLAWRTMEPKYLERLARLLERYRAAAQRQLASDDLTHVASATVAGRVETLLVEADRQIAGRIDAATGQVIPGELSDPKIGDVRNDLADPVASMKGEVIVVPAERMPSSTGIAATYRY